MTARRARLDDVSEAYIARVLASFPPLTEERKMRLSRLLTPPNWGTKSGPRTGQDAAGDGGSRAA